MDAITVSGGFEEVKHSRQREEAEKMSARNLE
jgi:hypothetical protein